MSFILDALKKSESDRQRQSGPSLFEVKVAPPRRALPVWAIAIAVLLGINIIVISWMLLRRASAQPPAAANTAAAAAAPAARAAPAAAMAANTAPARVAPAAARAPAPAGAAVSGSGESAPTAADDGAPPADANASAYAPAIEPSGAEGAGGKAGTAGALPLYQQIVTSDDLPALHLDLHVFAANPKDRFVMINMHELDEGASLPNGVRVEAIRPDGVVLSYRGTRFLLPRE